MLPGETAFKLYDTYGFPFDLTEDALKARGIGVDTKGFAAAMERQRAEARKSWAGSGEAATETLWFELKEELGATEFLGYDAEGSSGEIVALIKDGKRVSELKAGERGIVIVNQTPFYAESGGQVGDRGLIAAPSGARFAVEDTQKKLHGLFLHMGAIEAGTLKSARLSISKSIIPAAPRRAPIIPPRISCTRRCARCLGCTLRRRARWSSPGGSASTSPIRGR